MGKLFSLVVPAYNEEKTIESVIRTLYSLTLPEKWSLEVIVINDCSKDTTAKVVSSLLTEFSTLSLITNESNLGKSRSVKKGILLTKGDYVAIQDADLEYEPKDLMTMLHNAIDSDLDVVFGNRFGKQNKLIYPSYYLGNLGVTAFSNIFTFPRIGKFIPDMEVCYKLIRGDVFRTIASSLTATSTFGFEPEVTAKVARYKKENSKKLSMEIVPIMYHPRSFAEGKKIRWSDGVKALWEIVTYNLF
jgi:glycosyltransferase involved in cell wall biosynthesis